MQSSRARVHIHVERVNSAVQQKHTMVETISKGDRQFIISPQPTKFAQFKIGRQEHHWNLLLTEWSLPPNLPAVSNFVTVLLLIAGDIETNPGPSASSSMGSVNNLNLKGIQCDKYDRRHRTNCIDTVLQYMCRQYPSF